jgi:hypothetical protein
MPSSNAWGSPYAPSSNGSSRFTIPFLVSPNAFVVVPFHQGVRDEKMLEKLATHDIQDVSALFSLVDKYTKAVKGHAWHSPVAQVAKGDRKPNAGTQAQGNNKKKKAGGSQPLDGAPTIIATAAGEGRGGGGGQEATNAPVSCPIAMMTAQSAQLHTTYYIRVPGDLEAHRTIL